MPWHVMRSDSCPAAKPWAVMTDDPHAVVACHATEEDAERHVEALYAAEPEASRAVAAYSHIDFTPPEGVREEARKGLAWRAKHGRGGTMIGVARARDLSGGRTVSPATARRMKAYFDRHEGDRRGEGWAPSESGFPSAGRIAWALWGGDPGRVWAEKLVRQMNAADERSGAMATIERRAFRLPESPEDRSTLLRIERRGEGDAARDWIVGYAPQYGVETLDGAVGEFVERIAPGAFEGCDMTHCRALWNHNDDYPLGRPPETLRLVPDARGLRFEFPVGRASYARDLQANIQDGIVQGNSFSFVCGRDSWTVDERGRHVRTVESIASLWDVGPVTYPAYGDGALDVARRSHRLFVESLVVPPSPVELAARAAMERGRRIAERLKVPRG